MRVLIVEDEALLCERLRLALAHEGYAVETAAEGETGLYLGRELALDAAIIDLGLPKISGMDLIRKLRDEGRDFPILILTARDHWQDKVSGLSAGADDYVAKPFHMEEVIARVNALLRRSKGQARPEIKSGPVRLEMTAQRVVLNDTEMDLTAYEYKVLEYLMLNPGKVISKTELTEHIYAQDFERDSNVIEVFLGRVRKKFSRGANINPIETLRGRGYRWVLPLD